ncbi:hypothetical protein NJC40_09410 [Pseudomonas sp. 21LCFQ02]|uniref:hypothetical protein n=1 Tax=unclassified Pseudomonas TaxID=196821 RepID=UPI0004F90799|nr:MULTISPECIES: hypothetical protein [unclassified Pseudomonas]MCO8160830.1 hypothetical protein [Pseudomonas sp. 21LCFQ010]MCO8167991.1 hypothetical protein [Pseudomonas sp. 21LCFQ02]BAP44593.1 hypothetical protein PSCI_3891 [Pseudomonas sp. StFLB209]
MSEPKSHQGNTRRELRKALVRLRMEMHRQEIRHESTQVLQPLRRVRGMAQGLPGSLGIRHAPLWGVGAVALLGFLGGRGANKPPRQGGGGLARLIRLGVTLMPLIKLAIQSRTRKP